MIKKYNPFTGTFDYLNEGNGVPVLLYESITHADLLGKIQAGSLSVGRKYLISDFRTKHNIEGTNNLHEDQIEPLLVVASAVDELNSRAESQLHPTDVIEYDCTNILCEDAVSARKGKITFRKDKNGNQAPYDFRGVTFYRFTPDCPAWQAGNYSAGQFAKVGNDIYKCSRRSLGPAFVNGESPDISLNWIKFLPNNKSFLTHEISAICKPGMENYAIAQGVFSYTSAQYYTFSNSLGQENSAMFSGVKIGNARDLAFYSNNVFFSEITGRIKNVSLADGAQNNSFDTNMENVTLSGDTLGSIFNGATLVGFNSPGICNYNIIGSAFNVTILGPAIGNIVHDISISTILSEFVYNDATKIANTLIGSDFWGNTVIDLRYSFLSYHFKFNFIEFASEINSHQRVEECWFQNAVTNCVIENELILTTIPAGTTQTTFACNNFYGIDLSGDIAALLHGEFHKKLILGQDTNVYVSYIDAAGVPQVRDIFFLN